MGYKIVIDSCGELPDRCRKDSHFESVPLTLDIDGYQIVDDETFDQADMLKRIAGSPNCPHSACPSPERYRQAYECEAENVYAVTLSSQLSGSFNSAVAAKQMYKEEHADGRQKKNIHVFNSCSASIGQTLIALKIEELEKAGLKYREIVEKVEAYIRSQRTYFVLDNLETLRKNGRLSRLKALVAGVLNIKPILGSTPEGEICQLAQTRGSSRALAKMVDLIVEGTKDSANKILAISHCNCRERAEFVKAELMKRLKLKEIIILDTAGVSTLYANDGGVIVVV